MQPLKLTLPLLLTVFHVTNKGYASTSLPAFFSPRVKPFESENSEVRDEEFDAAEDEDAVASEGVLDDADGTLEELEEPPGVLRRRDIAAGL
jgi:hypothetical protein